MKAREGIENMCSQVWMFGHAAAFQEVRVEQHPIGSLSIALKGKGKVFAVSFASVPQPCRATAVIPVPCPMPQTTKGAVL